MMRIQLGLPTLLRDVGERSFARAPGARSPMFGDDRSTLHCKALAPALPRSNNLLTQELGADRRTAEVLWRRDMSLLQRLEQARAALDERNADPWKRMLQRDLPADVMSISTVALLDLLDAPATTGNARRLARTMRSMGFIPLKSRRLMPGGLRDTKIRGWARPAHDVRNLPLLRTSVSSEKPGRGHGSA
jgi:hypothetical protein